MENVLQLVLTLAGVVVAITLVVAVAHLSAIRKALETLVQQGRMPVQARREEALGDVLPSERAPEQSWLASRPAVVSPPPAAPVERTRFAAPEQVVPINRPAVVNPPPPPPVEQARFEEAPQQPRMQEAPDQVLPTEEAEPAYAPATVSPPLIPAEPKASRLPVLIGIVVLVCAIGFLAFLVLYTK